MFFNFFFDFALDMRMMIMVKNEMAVKRVVRLVIKLFEEKIRLTVKKQKWQDYITLRCKF
ncbi:hypothetical protein CHH78_15540 [Shouchella clausii]|nr:hypothetical protein BC8716_05495 [Shouchella clausii]PAD07928.1 hypothetical protein CHH76_17395 [Shouchella clausii]PAD12300.1 hypothetical protein CHH74_16195 [Shouchella clausii]PAE79512.1 hypothetical protein CHH77_19875 [Shouchella clausii]PAE80221.1 hypothetical protein CHH78_15540 [Shouchella clausii]